MFVLMLSIFVANVANIIDVDSHALEKLVVNVDKDSDDDTRYSLSPKKFEIADSYDNLLWFLQVSLKKKIFLMKNLYFFFFKL